ncbi:hypothetical protein SAMD00019534_101250 [Acytostelium subglobosum LB1]|uniref:hypothetical protein n=1 Tax=Acytostelium subglobosum LB1 TaxID=1410327 RepID=UPI0006448E83|nr:hypothetical protein SAMD00019534_101250 [Acytostelium subglobosum LB1]GAM26950.1 hypothetical protein SAMD00019534_101250 [Acytostelium subglobosum LB1]|eukprot:XP_012750218.1 hypothetical protein SAMD00019534_101250 [Acytostelium subglobosum LB1]
MAWNYVNYDVTHFLLTAMYLVLGALATYAWYHRPTSNVSPIQKIFYPLMLFGVTVRAMFMCMQPFIREDDFQIPNQVNILLNTLPSFIFFSNYLIVLFIWVEMYLIFEGKSMSLVHSLPWFFKVIALIMYGIVLVLYVLDFALYPLTYSPVSVYNDLVEYIIGTFDGALFIVFAMAFLIVCICMIIKFQEHNPNFTEEKRRLVLWRVTTVSILVVVCFLIRGAITLFAVNRFNLISGKWWWFDGVYYFGFEIIPITILLFLLRANNNHDHHTYSHSTNIKKQDIVIYPATEYTHLLHN